jgi:hypothetical protein
VVGGEGCLGVILKTNSGLWISKTITIGLRFYIKNVKETALVNTRLVQGG